MASRISLAARCTFLWLWECRDTEESKTEGLPMGRRDNAVLVSIMWYYSTTLRRIQSMRRFGDGRWCSEAFGDEGDEGG